MRRDDQGQGPALREPAAKVVVVAAAVAATRGGREHRHHHRLVVVTTVADGLPDPPLDANHDHRPRGPTTPGEMQAQLDGGETTTTPREIAATARMLIMRTGVETGKVATRSTPHRLLALVRVVRMRV